MFLPLHSNRYRDTLAHRLNYEYSSTFDLLFAALYSNSGLRFLTGTQIVFTSDFALVKILALLKALITLVGLKKGSV